MAEANAQDAPPKDKKKLIIIIAAAVALLAILGGGAMFLLGGSKDKKEASHEGGKTEAKAEGHAEAKAEGGHGGEGHGEGKAGEAGGSSSYPLEPFVVNIYDGQELRYLKIKVEFELSNPAAKAELDAKVAPLRDAVLVLLTTKTMQEVQDLQGKNLLRDQILGAVGKIIPAGKVTKVYFTDFVVQ